MKKLFLILSILMISYAGIAQEVQTFVSENMTQLKLNRATGNWDTIKSIDKIIPITYGPKYVQVGTESGTKYVLYGEVEKSEDENATFYIQKGFLFNGGDMRTWTIYGKKTKYIKVGIEIGDSMFLFRLQDPYK